MGRTRIPAVGIVPAARGSSIHVAIADQDGAITALSSFSGLKTLIAWLQAVPGCGEALLAVGDGRSGALPAPRFPLLRRLRVPGIARITELCTGLAAAFPQSRLVVTDPGVAAERLLDSPLRLPLALFHGRPRERTHHGFLRALVAADTAWRLAHGSSPLEQDRGVMPPVLLPAAPFREYTLCLVRDERRLLLGYKKRGIGAGYWNGFGGKIETGESPEEAAQRELHEESGLWATSLRPIGELSFVFKDGTWPIHGHVFLASGYTGTPQESDEMVPRWFALERIPYKKMWPDDRFWLPLALEGHRFRAVFRFDENGDLAEQGVDFIP